MKKETICWKCQNFAKCSWSRGIPVENWDATPTIRKEIEDGEEIITRSYCVNSCPQFLEDVLVEKEIEEITKMLGISRRTFFRWKKTNELVDQLKEKGYLFSQRNKRFYLEKIGGQNESKNK